jgi:hypothetical protein
LAHWPVHVDAVEPGPFGSGTGQSKRYDGMTDAQGNYSFTFPFAKAPGQQTDTDYYLRVKVPSTAHPGQEIAAEYELELLEREHNAPDLVLWDPTFGVTANDRSFVLSVTPRAASKNYAVAFIDEESVASAPGNAIDLRDTEDAAVSLSPRAYADISSAGTIYHQRFLATRLPARGTLVPLSRGAACTATFESGATQSCERYTDGDLRSGEEAPASWPETIVVDLRSMQTVGEVRARLCGCTATVSADGTNWTPVSASGSAARYVRLTSSVILDVSHISVWPPRAGVTASNSRKSTTRTPPTVALTPLATTPPPTVPLAVTPVVPPTTVPRSFASSPPRGRSERAANSPLGAVAVLALAGAAYPTFIRARRAWQ